MPDTALLRAHLDGDPDAFASLFTRHKDVLWAVALRVTGHPEDAADALQDAMISALRSAGGFEGRSAVRTWLYRIVVNASLDRLRRANSRPTVPLGEHDPAVRRDEITAAGLRMDLREALSQLSPGQRAAVLLVDAHGLPVAEVADILEVPVGTVKSRCARARAQLAGILSEPPPGRIAGGPGHSGNASGAGGVISPDAAGRPTWSARGRAEGGGRR